MHPITNNSLFRYQLGDNEAYGHSYLAVMFHSTDLQAMASLVSTNARTIEGIRKVALASGIYHLWKAGDVTPLTFLCDRLTTTLTGIGSGREDWGTTRKIYVKLIEEGGYALVVMIPMPQFESETDLKKFMAENHSEITIDNLKKAKRKPNIKQNRMQEIDWSV